MPRKLLAAFMGHAALAALLTSAGAQAPSTPPPDENTAGKEAGEEVVVTAQRRKENVQRVPIAVSAISGDKLDEQRGDMHAAAATRTHPG